jgi:hypothetical protein
VAGGTVVSSSTDGVVVELDEDSYEGTGWTHVYRFLSAFERVGEGTHVRAGDPLGHPSCEGGLTSQARVSFARKFNGEWIPVDARFAPLVLGGWIPSVGDEPGQGLLVHQGLPARHASETQNPAVNGVTVAP